LKIIPVNEDLHVFLRSRRSIRQFKPDPIPLSIIQTVLETAIFAPSAHNTQPWRFVVLTSTDGKSRLAESITARFRHDMLTEDLPEIDIQARVERSTKRVKEAPVIIIFFLDRTQADPKLDSLQQKTEALLGVQTVAMAGLQLLLAAHAEGLGGTWICWPLFAPEETRQALGVVPEWEPQGMVFLGYPAETPELPKRITLQQITRFL